jgi:hypothetical protein
MWVGLLRTSLALLLALSVCAKARSMSRVRAAVGQYGFVPDRFVGVATALLTSVEGCVATLLVVDVAPRLALAASAVLFAGFALNGAVTLRRRGSVDCGCLGNVLTVRADWLTVALDGSLAILSTVAAVQSAATLSIGHGAREHGLAIALTWSCGAIAAITYWLAAYARGVAALVQESTTGGG